MTLSPQSSSAQSIAAQSISAQPISTSLFSKFGVVSAALIYTTLTFGAALTPAPAEARTSTVYYTAELAAPAAEARSIIDGMVWYCEGTTCRATKSNSRPINVCKRLSKDMGEVTAFTVKGAAITDEELAKCNA